MAGTGALLVTCAVETREATGDGDRLAHNPEVLSARRPFRQIYRTCYDHRRPERFLDDLSGGGATANTSRRLFDANDLEWTGIARFGPE